LNEFAPPRQLNRSVALFTMAVIFFGSSVVLLIAASFFWFRDGFGRSLRNPARRVAGSLSLFALAGAVLLFVRFLSVVESHEFLGLSLAERIDATTSIVRAGFWLTTVAFVSCWFATFKTAICIAVSSVPMWILWAVAAMV